MASLTRACTAAMGQRLQSPPCAKCDGRIKNASNSDTPSTKTATIGNTLKNWPHYPVGE